ncbi:MAG: enoyl-CoA hydratase/isomerase family protein [Chloroflexota bacterium]
MAYSSITYEKEGRLGIVTFNRPEVRNALSWAMVAELEQAVDEAEADDEVGALILTGAGERAFMAGADLNEMAARNLISELGPAYRQRRRLTDRLENMYKPTIAAVNGYAVGGGCELALACTLRIAAETAKFGQPEINLGIIPGLGGTQRLARLVGKGRAMELVLTGDLIDAHEAYRIGLVNKVVPAGELMAAAKELGNKLASKPPIAMRAAKDAINLGLGTDLRSALELEARLFAICAGTQDKAEGVAAFWEKRPPHWQGR